MHGYCHARGRYGQELEMVSYREKGNGNPLVLIHGFCETNRIWDRFADDLSLSCRVLTPDLPGFGHSPLPTPPFSIRDIGLKVLEWLDDLHLTKSVVIGHSLGGYVALAMVAQQSERFVGFGLFHSTASADSREKKENRNKIIDFVARNGVRPFIDTFVPGLFHQKKNPFIPEVYKIASQTTAQTLIAYAEAMRDRPSAEDVVRSFAKPILMIAGEHDTVIPYDRSSQQADLMQFPFFCGLTNVGHMGMFENEPTSLKIVKDFMNLALDFNA